MTTNAEILAELRERDRVNADRIDNAMKASLAALAQSSADVRELGGDVKDLAEKVLIMATSVNRVVDRLELPGRMGNGNGGEKALVAQALAKTDALAATALRDERTASRMERIRDANPWVSSGTILGIITLAAGVLWQPLNERLSRDENQVKEVSDSIAPAIRDATSNIWQWVGESRGRIGKLEDVVSRLNSLEDKVEYLNCRLAKGDKGYCKLGEGEFQ